MDVLLVKYCSGCNKIFLATSEFFYKDKSRKNGLQVYCKVCQNKAIKKHYEENKDKVKNYSLKYYEENKEKVSERHRKYREENREKLNEYGRKYNKENSGIKLALEAKRRAIKLNQTPILTQEEKQQIISIYKKAQELGQNWHVDHITPLSKGGLHHPNNLQIVAKKYNLEKGSRLNFRLPLDTEVHRWLA